MSVSTKGIVAGNFENNVFEVIEKIKKGLLNVTTTNVLKREVSASYTAQFDISPIVRMVSVVFKDGNEQRLLSVHFDCHNDEKDVLDGDKLIFSMGCFGNSAKIISDILMQFDEPKFLIPNDCVNDSQEYFQELNS